MGWEYLQGQDAAVDSLRRDLGAGRVAGAYIFYGPEGVGKATAARLFAQALQCPGEAAPAVRARSARRSRAGCTRT